MSNEHEDRAWKIALELADEIGYFPTGDHVAARDAVARRIFAAFQDEHKAISDTFYEIVREWRTSPGTTSTESMVRVERLANELVNQ